MKKNNNSKITYFRKNVLAILLGLGLCVLFLNLCVLHDTAAADNRTVRVGVYENEPKVFTAASGEPAGIFIDFIEYIAEAEGWNLEYVSGTWAQGLVRLEKGEIDLMPDVAFSTERGKKYSFHKITALSPHGPRYMPARKVRYNPYWIWIISVLSCWKVQYSRALLSNFQKGLI